MKKSILLFVSCFLLAFGALAASPKRVLADLDNVDDVERIYVGAAFLSDIHLSRLSGLHKDAVKNLKGIEVLTASGRAGRQLAAEFGKLVENDGYTLINEINQDRKDYTRIYARKVNKKSPNLVSTVVVEVMAGSVLTLVAIDADVDMSKMEESSILTVR